MEIRANFKASINLLIITRNETHLLSARNRYNLNVGIDHIDDIINNVFTDRAMKKYNNIYGNSIQKYINNNYFLQKGELVIFYDILFFYLYLFGKIQIPINAQYIGFFVKGKIHILSIAQIGKDSFARFIFFLDDELMYSLNKILLSEDNNLISINKNYILGVTIKIDSLNLKNFSLYKDKIASIDIKNKKIKYFEIIDFYKRDCSVFNYLSQSEYIKSLNKTVKITTTFGPISKIKLRKKVGNSNGMGYGCIAYYSLCRKDLFWHNFKINSSGGYDDKDKKIAKIKSFVEGIERFNSGYFESDYKMMSSNIINHDISEKIAGLKLNFEFYKGKEMNYSEIREVFSDNQNILVGKKEIIPYHLLYYPVYNNDRGFYHSNSNGIGAGRSYEEAFLGGLFELSERDSIVLTWLKKLTPDLIDKKTLPTYIKKRVSKLEKAKKGEIFLFDISYDKGFPHILGFYVYKEGDEVRYILGASASNNLYDTINKSLNEIGINVFFGKNTIVDIKNYNNVNSVSDHKDYFNQNGNIKYLYFLFEGNKVVDYDKLDQKLSTSNSLGSILKLLECNVGGGFFISNLTTEYSRNLGIYVLRVLSEKLVPIWFGHNSKLPLKKQRLANKGMFEEWKKHSYKYKIPDFLHFFN